MRPPVFILTAKLGIIFFLFFKIGSSENEIVVSYTQDKIGVL
jgi:hypothetical protein